MNGTGVTKFGLGLALALAACGGGGPRDGGVSGDGAARTDSGRMDSAVDAGATDSGGTDGGALDGGVIDSGSADSGSADSGGAGPCGDDVFDGTSSICWRPCPLGQTGSAGTCSGAATTLGWAEALTACPAGYRVPRLAEASALLDGCGVTVDGAGQMCASCTDSPSCSALFGADLSYFWLEERVPVSPVDMAWYANYSLAWVGHQGLPAPLQVRCVKPAP